MTMAISRDHRVARNQASITLADSGAQPSVFKFFTAPGGVLLGMRRLAKPCASITSDGRISFNVASTSDQVLATGSPTYGQWCSGDGLMIADGTVSGPGGSGSFKLQGTALDGNGDPTLMIYEGGLLELVLPALLG